MSERLKRLLKRDGASIDVVKAAESVLTEEALTQIETNISTINSKINAQQFEKIFDNTNREYTEEFMFSSDILGQKNYYVDSSKTTKIWQVDFIYDMYDKLIEKKITHIFTGISLTITYNYDVNDVITQKDRVLE